MNDTREALILSDSAIVEGLRSGAILIEPSPRDGDVRQLGVRIHAGRKYLGKEALTAGCGFERLSAPELPKEGVAVGRGEFLLVEALQSIQLARSLACFLDGRSTLARCGLSIHQTSSVIDNVYDSPIRIVLELFNAGPSPVEIRRGMPIGMLIFVSVLGEIFQPDSGQYGPHWPPIGPNLRASSPDRVV